MIALSDLIKALTPAELKQSFLDVADTLGLSTSSWKALDPVRTMLAIVAEVMSDRQELEVQAIGGGFLDYAEGDWLTLKAAQDYNVTRIVATFASGELTFTNNSGETQTHGIGEVVFENTTTDATYRNTEAISVADGATQDVDILAEEAGTASTAQATEIDALVTVIPGVTVSNAAAVIGTDDETDAELVTRCRESTAALSPAGAAAAYSFVAKSTLRADESTVDITRVRVDGDTSDGTVTVLLAGSAGAPLSADVTLVDAELQEKVVPIGITATVSGATNTTIAITYTAIVATADTATDAEITAAVEARLTAYFKALPIAGQQRTADQHRVFYDQLEAQIMRAHDSILTLDLTTPSANVELTATEVPVLGTITPTVTRVTQ